MWLVIHIFYHSLVKTHLPQDKMTAILTDDIIKRIFF